MQRRIDLGWLMTGLLAAIGAPMACGGTSQAAEGGAGGTNALVACNPTTMQRTGGFEACAEGYVHRPEARECPPPPYPACDPVANPGGECAQNSDCTAAPNGTCTSDLGGYCLCAYSCRTDADCGEGFICGCGELNGTIGLHGQCVPAGCQSDADCDGMLCASYSNACGAMGFACFSPADQCRTDADCEAGNVCQVNSADGTRSCVFGGCGGIGRPFLVCGTERLAETETRADWAAGAGAPGVAGLDGALRSALSQAWSRVGLMEHASIAAFARFALELLSLGAPAELIELTHAAMADETRHARICFALAGAYGGAPVGPGRLDVRDALVESDLVDIVRTTIVEGCIGETIAAAEAAEAARHAVDPVVANVLSSIAHDEARHAALAWRFVAWAIEGAPAQARERIAAELERAARSKPPEIQDELPPELAQHGFVVGAARASLRAQVADQIVAPCARALARRAVELRDKSPSANALPLGHAV